MIPLCYAAPLTLANVKTYHLSSKLVDELQRNEDCLREEEAQEEPVKDGFELFAT